MPELWAGLRERDARYWRMASLFDDEMALVPLETWLPESEQATEALEIMERLLPLELRVGVDPYLLLPIGNGGHNPEVVLRFNGVIAVPRYRTGHRHRLARVMIDLFGFNAREELLYERARAITYLFLAHAHATTEDGPLVEEGRRAINALTSDAAAHANCSRCYARLLEEDQVGAREIFEAAWEYVEAV